MANRDGLGQGDEVGHQQSPSETRRQLDPMGPEEVEAFEWVIAKMAANLPDASFNQLIDEATGWGWFTVRDGMLYVNEEAGDEDRP